MYNQTVQTFSANIPNSLRLINSTAAALNNSIIRNKYARTVVSVSDMFYNPQIIKDALSKAGFDKPTTDVFMAAIVRMGMISGDLAAVELPEGMFSCSTPAISLFLPQAKSKLIHAVQKSFCSSDEKTRSIIKLIQNNIDFKFVQNYYANLSMNFDNSGKIADSLTSGISLINDIKDLLGKNKRKKRGLEETTESLSTIILSLSSIVEQVSQYYDEQKFACILKMNKTNANMLLNINHCNLTEYFTPMLDMIGDQIPLWKNALLLMPTNRKDYYRDFKNCQVDVNRYIYLTNLGTIEQTDDTIRCNASRKRQALDLLYLLKGLDVTIIKENLETWRKEAFISTEWQEELTLRMQNVYIHMMDIVTSVQNLPISMLDESTLTDPTTLQLLFSGKASSIMTSLSSALNESSYFFKNSPLGDNITKVLENIGKCTCS